MTKFRRTSIKAKKKNTQSTLVGDLVNSGALIFTKTTFDMSTIKKGGGCWRFLIRAVQWFRWARQRGDPSTITHVDGWDGKVAFGSDLCDPEGGGLNRHHLPIVPHCFIGSEMVEEMGSHASDSLKIKKVRKGYKSLKMDEFALGDYEIIQFPESLRVEFLSYQEKFRNDDIKYSLRKAAKSIFIKSKFSRGVQKAALADGIFCYLGEPFRDQIGSVIQVCCSTFLAKILMAIEHKQKLEAIINSDGFELKNNWSHSFKNLRVGFDRLNMLHSELRDLVATFDKEWHQVHKLKSKNERSLLIELCVDFEERRGFALREIRKLSTNIATRIYSMVDVFFAKGFYESSINAKEKPVLFSLNPECVTPAKLYYFLFEISEKDNEP